MPGSCHLITRLYNPVIQLGYNPAVGLYNLAVVNTREEPEGLTEEQAERMLADMNEVIRAGEEMRQARIEMIKLFAEYGWTQDKIARLADMSQPAVSKQVAKNRTPHPPMPLSLDQADPPWLEGRLWGLAEEICEASDDTARCTRHVIAIARGRKRFTPQNVDELRRLVESDLLDQAGPGGRYRAAYDEIARNLDLASVSKPARTKAGATKPLPAATVPPGAASVRRALARQIQRDRLRSDAG